MARSYQCWDCGRQVSADEVQRYEVARYSAGSGRSVRIYTRHQRVNLCPACFAKHQRRDRIQGAIVLALIAAAVLYFVLR